MQKCYKFIRDDVFLCARVNPINGKQKLVIKQIDLQTGKIIRQDSVDCIHTAVCSIPAAEFKATISDPEFIRNIINIRTSENLKEINLSPEEKFKAMKSWVAGIAEAGKDAFSIQAEIDAAANLMYPIMGKLMKFMCTVEPEIAFEYLAEVEKNSVWLGVRSESYLMASLIPILDMINSWADELGLDTFEKYIMKFGEIISAVFDLKPPIKLFTRNIN